MKKCALCGRSLRNPVSIAAGVGPVCRKKIDNDNAVEVLREIRGDGYDGVIVPGGVQLAIAEGS